MALGTNTVDELGSATVDGFHQVDEGSQLRVYAVQAVSQSSCQWMER